MSFSCLILILKKQDIYDFLNNKHSLSSFNCYRYFYIQNKLASLEKRHATFLFVFIGTISHPSESNQVI